MSFALRQAWPTDLADLVALAVDCQADPARSCAYLSADVDAISAELTEIDGVDDWWSVTWVALDDARNVLGWIAGESDAEMGRVWWFGPFLSTVDVDDPMTAAIPDALLRAGADGVAALGTFPEHEIVADARSVVVPDAARRAGFVAGEGSVALLCKVLDGPVPDTPAEISELVERDERIVVLHDELFPGTHSPGSLLFGDHRRSSDRHDCFVARIDGVPIGYVATEVQQDGSLYIDYLGVGQAARGAGVGAALVAAAMRNRADEATYAHLTVRTSNEAARRVYRRLGFSDDVVLVPYRRGFSLS